MTATRRKTFWRRLRHRLWVAVSLLAYLAASLGFPLPAPARLKSAGGQPFPCQDNPCGCQTAEQCWTHCCCLTPEQHWEWARRNHVEPPAYATRPEPQGWRTTPRRAGAAAAASETTCAACARGAAQPCCHNGAGDCCRPKPAEPAKNATPPDEAPVRWALGVSALHCQGYASLWVGGGAVLPAPPGPSWRPGLLPVGWVLHADPAAPRVPTSPPTPPPRPTRA
jgi:hypothetical protein